MLSVYCENAAGEVVLLKRGVTKAEALALAGEYFEKDDEAVILVCSDSEGGAADD